MASDASTGDNLKGDLWQVDKADNLSMMGNDRGMKQIIGVD